jgi:hypothetical protein
MASETLLARISDYANRPNPYRCMRNSARPVPWCGRPTAAV